MHLLCKAVYRYYGIWWPVCSNRSHEFSVHSIIRVFFLFRCGYPISRRLLVFVVQHVYLNLVQGLRGNI